MRKCVILIFAVLVGQMLSAQDFEYSWQRVRMDSAYESDTVYGVDSIVAAHQEQMTPLMEVVIYSSEEIKEGRPESALSNLAADMLLYAVSDRLNNGLERFASGKFEALGGVEIVVRDGELEKCLIGGRPLEDDALYNLVTIDFLLDGGDRFDIGDDAVSIDRTGIVLRDAAVRYLRDLSESGIVLENKGDGRVIIEKD